MELRHLSPSELSLYLERRAPGLGDLVAEDRAAVVRMARRLVQRGLSHRFVLATVHNTVELLRRPPGGYTPAAPPVPMAEGQPAAAARLAENTRAALREARSARRSNEVRKMRGVLRSIDRARLRESLGDEGERLCHEIECVLDRLAMPVRRGRPRAPRAVL